MGHILGEQHGERFVMLDPTTGGELAQADRSAPWFVLSTQDEATDGNIVLQHWDLSRAESCGVPVLWNHDADVLLGTWRDLGVRQREGGPALMGRPYLDTGDAVAANRQRQIEAGHLRGMSVGWIPGDLVRRGELPEGSPYRREMREDECGLPAEGYAMGSPTNPNRLVEVSLTPVPAQAEAHIVDRMLSRGGDHIGRAARGEPYDVDVVLATLAGTPKVRAFIDRLVRAAVAEAMTRTPSATPSPRTLSALFRS